MRLEFAKAVRRHRTRLGFTQEELAWRAGLHRTYLAGIESGSRNPSLQSIARLARALEISLSVLFGETEKEPRPGHASTRRKWPGGLAEIVLVEDNPQDVEMTRRALAKIGLINPLRVLRDGAEALDYLLGRGLPAARPPKKPPMVVLLDLELPKLNGLELLREIKGDARTTRIPVAVLTVSERSRDVAESRRLGAEAYIVKPVDFTGLSRAVPQLRLRWALLDSVEDNPRVHVRSDSPV